jgi:serine/threonine protein kinase
VLNLGTTVPPETRQRPGSGTAQVPGRSDRCNPRQLPPEEPCRPRTETDPIQRLNAAPEGRYRIEGELGEGEMATILLADDLKHDRSVALEVLAPELAAVVGAERFLAEIKTTAHLSTPTSCRGSVRELIRFDDPGRHPRPEVAIQDGTLVYTLRESEADIWLMEILWR